MRSFRLVVRDRRGRRRGRSTTSRLFWMLISSIDGKYATTTEGTLGHGRFLSSDIQVRQNGFEQERRLRPDAEAHSFPRPKRLQKSSGHCHWGARGVSAARRAGQSRAYPTGDAGGATFELFRRGFRSSTWVTASPGLHRRSGACGSAHFPGDLTAIPLVATPSSSTRRCAPSRFRAFGCG
jgi:hypothetical protein